MVATSTFIWSDNLTVLAGVVAGVTTDPVAPVPARVVADPSKVSVVVPLGGGVLARLWGNSLAETAFDRTIDSAALRHLTDPATALDQLPTALEPPPLPPVHDWVPVGDIDVDLFAALQDELRARAHAAASVTADAAAGLPAGDPAIEALIDGALGDAVEATLWEPFQVRFGIPGPAVDIPGGLIAAASQFHHRSPMRLARSGFWIQLTIADLELIAVAAT